MRIHTTLIVILLAGCPASTTPKEPTITKEQQTNDCQPPVNNLVGILMRGETANVPMADKLRSALLERCIADLWGKDAMDCFGKLQTIDQAEGCAKYLTVPQRDGFQQAIENATR
jgi:hypothetical protein